MSYYSYIPCEALRPFVVSIAISESADAADYKVLPGTGLVLGFQYKGKLSKLDDRGEIQLSTTGITGLHDRYHIFKNVAGTGSVLVYFKDAAAGHFFSQPVHELFGESVALEHMMLRSELLLLEEQLCEAESPEDKVSLLEQFLLSRLRTVEQDTLVLSALALIYNSKGTIRIKELAAQLFTSQSPLEKRFRSVVGASPKKFASIVRLKHTIPSYSGSNSLPGSDMKQGFTTRRISLKSSGRSREKHRIPSLARSRKTIFYNCQLFLQCIFAV